MKRTQIYIALFLVALAVLFVGKNIHEKGKVSNKIFAEIQDYTWFEKVVEYEGTFWPNHVNYGMRATLAQHLEEVGFYWAATTPYCEDQTDEFHDQASQTCFIGTAEQNLALLAQLQKPQVQEYLATVSPYDMVNGPTEAHLKRFIGYAAKYCTDEIEKTGKCGWQDHVDAMSSLTR